MEKLSNYELNGFLTILTERWDESAAQAVVNTFHTQPVVSNHVRITRETKNNASTTGHTNEAGNITVFNEETKETVSGEENVARIGYYKVRRLSWKTGVSFILWGHFWASDPITESFDKALAPKFSIEYDEETLTPQALVRWDVFKEEGAKPPLRLLLRWTIKSFYNILVGRHYKFEYVSYIAHPTVLFGKSSNKAM